jgi:peptide/nickel transport system substrate-binding protein
MAQASMAEPAARGLSRRAFLAAGGRSAAALAGATSLSGMLAACGGGAASRTAPSATGLKRGGTLHVAIDAPPDSLDPAKSALYEAAKIYDSIFDQLVDFDEHGRIYGVLASDWRLLNPTTWLFDLKPGVTFHNGDPFTAADVKYTLERIVDPKTASSYAAQFSALQGVEVRGKYRVAIHLTRPFAPLLANLASNGQIVNRRAIETTNAANTAVGTGAFKFVEWVQGDHLSVKRNENYGRVFSGLPSLDAVRYTFPVVAQPRVDALRAGQLDFLDGVPLQAIAAVSNDPAFNLVTSATTGLADCLFLNVSRSPLNNKALRQAIALAVDKQEILKVGYLGTGSAGSQEVAPGSPWYDLASDPYRAGPDIAAAKAKMRAAGLASGVNIEFIAQTSQPEPTKVGEILKQQLAQIGITLKVVPLDLSTWFGRLSKLDYQMTIGFQERVIEPDGFYNVLLAADSGSNFQGYKNPALDKAVRAAEAELDPIRRKALYAKARAIVMDDCPTVFVHFTYFDYLTRRAVAGSTINPTQELRLARVGLVNA